MTWNDLTAEMQYKVLCRALNTWPAPPDNLIELLEHHRKQYEQSRHIPIESIGFHTR